MAQEKKPRPSGGGSPQGIEQMIRLMQEGQAGPEMPHPLLSLISDNAEPLIGMAGMVAGGPGGAGKKAAMRAAPKMMKKAGPALKTAKERFENALNSAPQDKADEFLKSFLPGQRGKGIYPRGITSPDPYDMLEQLWRLFSGGK